MKGFLLKMEGNIRIELNHRSFHQLQEIFIEKTNDNRILAVAKNLSLRRRNKRKWTSKLFLLVRMLL